MRKDKKLAELNKQWDAAEARCSAEHRDPFTDLAKLLGRAWNKHVKPLISRKTCDSKPPAP